MCFEDDAKGTEQSASCEADAQKRKRKRTLSAEDALIRVPDAASGFDKPSQASDKPPQEDGGTSITMTPT